MKGYHATWITRYPNSVATFNQDRLATSGDISLNPGPDRIVSDNGKKPAWKFSCAVCDKPVRRNQKGILCNSCDSWHHIKCIDMDVETYVALSYSQDQWFCKANNSNWPFDFSDSFFEFHIAMTRLYWWLAVKNHLCKSLRMTVFTLMMPESPPGILMNF